MRRAVVLFATAAVTVCLTATTTAAQPAQAAQIGSSTSDNPNDSALGGAYGCPGTVVEQDGIYSQWGTLYGYLDLYWDGTNNCAVTVHAPGYQNDPLPTSVGIESWPTWGTEGSPYEYKTDSGNYSSYAGPVSVYGVGRCVTAWAGISGPGAHTGAHCG